MTEWYTYLITYPHNATGRANSYKGTRHESFDVCFLCCIGERDLVQLCTWSDGTDNGVDAGQDTSKLRIIFNISEMDLYTTVFEFQDGWIGTWCRTYKCFDMLEDTMSMLSTLRSGIVFAHGLAIFKKAVDDSASSTPGRTHYQNSWFGHFAKQFSESRRSEKAPGF